MSNGRIEPTAVGDPSLPALLSRSRTQNIPGNDGTLNLAGAFVDREDAGVAVHSLNFGFAGVAETAVNLYCLVDDPIDHFARVQFGAGGGRAHFLSGILEKGGLVKERARGL